MNFVFLTQNNTFIIGFVAKILGFIMNGIFFVIDKIGIPNVGLAIILFTIVVNLLMMPLTVKQQKFSKLSAKMSPEIQAIQAKYKGKKDQESLMAQQQEIQAVYAKYGVSQSGSCLQLLIQMPILFALYRVIYSMPAYVTKIGNTFRVLADAIIAKDGAAFLKESEITTIATTVRSYGSAMMNDATLQNGVVDVLNKLSSEDLNTVANYYDLYGKTYDGVNILANESSAGLINSFNNFLGLNMSDSPLTLIKNAWAAGSIAIVIGALLIPILSAVTQWINVKLMPQQPTNGNDTANSMAQSMKTMNMIMPIMSAWFCFSFPSGMGLYWVAGSVVRSIQQVIINKRFDKMDFDDIIKKNSVKSQKKIEKMKAAQERMNTYANMKTRSIQNRANVNTPVSNYEEIDTNSSSSNTDKTIKPGSMMAKANMVKQFNEKNNKKDEN